MLKVIALIAATLTATQASAALNADQCNVIADTYKIVGMLRDKGYRANDVLEYLSGNIGISQQIALIVVETVYVAADTHTPDEIREVVIDKCLGGAL